MRMFSDESDHELIARPVYNDAADGNTSFGEALASLVDGFLEKWVHILGSLVDGEKNKTFLRLKLQIEPQDDLSETSRKNAGGGPVQPRRPVDLVGQVLTIDEGR